MKKLILIAGLYIVICLYVHINSDYSQGYVRFTNDFVDWLSIVSTGGGFFGSSLLVCSPLLLLDHKTVGGTGNLKVFFNISVLIVLGVNVFFVSSLLHIYDSDGTIRYIMTFSLILFLLLFDLNGNLRHKKTDINLYIEKFGGKVKTIEETEAPTKAEKEAAEKEAAEYKEYLLKEIKKHEELQQRIEDKSVYVKGFSMPFGEMVEFMVKSAIASIPAFIILAIIGGILFLIFTAIFA